MSGSTEYRVPGVESVAKLADRLLALFLPNETASACEQYQEFCDCVSLGSNPLVRQRRVRTCCGGYCGSCYETGELC